MITHEYGPPIYSVGEHVKIMKDAAPGTHPRFSYDKLGVIKDVIDGNGSNANLYTVKVLFEPCSEQVDEGWLRRHDSTDKNDRKRTLKDKNIIIADLKGKLRIERKRSRRMEIDLDNKDRLIDVLREQNDNMAGKISELLSFKANETNAVANNYLIKHVVDQVSIFSKSTHRENLFLRREVFVKEQKIEKLEKFLLAKREEISDLTTDLRELLSEKKVWDVEMKKMDRLRSENVALRRDNERLLLELDELDQCDSKYIYGPPFFQMGDVVTNTCKVCFHAIFFTLNQVLYFIEFIFLAFPNLVQLQLGAYSLIIEVRWSTL